MERTAYTKLCCPLPANYNPVSKYKIEMMMRSWSFPAGRIFGVEIRIHLTFGLLLLYVLMTEAAGGYVGPGRALGLTGLVFLSVVLHELSHSLASLHSGRVARSVVLLPIGGVTLMDETSHQQVNPRQEIRIAAVGPFVNLLLAFVVGGIVMTVTPELNIMARPWVHSSNLLRSFVWINVFIGAVNLLPAYPLDGGRVLRAIFLRGMDPVRATRRAVAISQIFSMLFFVVGLWRDTWLVLIGFFIFVAAQLEERSAVFHAVLENVSLKEVMLTEFATLSPADTLEEALDKAVHSLQDDFPVVRGPDLVGVVSRQAILEALRAGGNGYIQPVMKRVADVGAVGDSLASAFRKISNGGMTLIPVVDGGRLVGIITLQNLMHAMSLLAQTKKIRRQQELE
jgi:Zn-dependent protease/predicted transcriptional regulator